MTVLRGAVRDVAVDVRVGSPTFGKHVAVDLDDENRRQFWVPRGFAHGFVVHSESADFFHKCDEFYSPADEKILRWNDPTLGIDWGVEHPILSIYVPLVNWALAAATLARTFQHGELNQIAVTWQRFQRWRRRMRSARTVSVRASFVSARAS